MQGDAFIHERFLLIERPDRDIHNGHARLRVGGADFGLFTGPVPENRNDLQARCPTFVKFVGQIGVAVKLLFPFGFFRLHGINARHLVVVDFPSPVSIVDLEVHGTTDLPA